MEGASTTKLHEVLPKLTVCCPHNCTCDWAGDDAWHTCMQHERHSRPTLNPTLVPSFMRSSTVAVKNGQHCSERTLAGTYWHAMAWAQGGHLERCRNGQNL